jgi:dUTPase
LAEDIEECILKREDAEKLAENFKRYEGKALKRDPFNNEEIPPSLLSAEHILKYVEKTGLVAPFYIKGGEKSRLKDAAYEGRIGSVAYSYAAGKQRPEQVFGPTDKFLKVPANSILFVECDLDFRLPEFIALRFNLQIKHVHRGLLLGTGPLVDPGYWGKLCIPLHNLTDEDYFIHREDGLIWVEFTKTTSNLGSEDDPIGRPPLGKPFWNIREFLDKATMPVSEAHSVVGIRSAIPTLYSAALREAEEANEAAKKSEISADKAQKKTSQTTFWGAIGGGIAMLSILVSVFALAYSYYSDMDAHFNELRPTLASLQSKSEKVDGAFSSLQSEATIRNQHMMELEQQLKEEIELRKKIEERLARTELFVRNALKNATNDDAELEISSTPTR